MTLSTVVSIWILIGSIETVSNKAAISVKVEGKVASGVVSQDWQPK